MENIENDVLNKIKEQRNEYPELSEYYEIVEETIGDECKFIRDGYYMKICEFGDNRDDGIYISKVMDQYFINKVNTSIKKMMEANYEDVISLIAYSYIVRIVSYIPHSSFVIVKNFTQEIEKILEKYNIRECP